MSERRYKPGEIAPASGQYAWRGREVTVVRGEPLPPTRAPRQTWRLVDRSNNKSGRGR